MDWVSVSIGLAAAATIVGQAVVIGVGYRMTGLVAGPLLMVALGHACRDGADFVAGIGGMAAGVALVIVAGRVGARLADRATDGEWEG